MQWNLLSTKLERRIKYVEISGKNHGEEKVLIEGYLDDIIQYLKDNNEIYTWILDEDKGMELPNLDEIKTLKGLEAELEKIDLGWWNLEVKE